MDATHQAISQQQRESWNRFAPGWKKWDDLMMDFLKPMGDAIIQHIKPKDGDRVLDIAAGTGEPGLTIAAMIPKGTVIITDLAEDMLTIATENASHKGLPNIETVACDVSALPFPDNSIDAISCRFGFMFFPDMELAAKEMVRVLKPGGRLATSVWSGPEKNFWVTAIGGIINKHLQPTPPPPGAPGMFRCAQPNLIQDLFKKAGLKATGETEITGRLQVGTAENYWTMMTEVAAPFVSALAKADAETKERIRLEVLEAVSQRYPDDVRIGASALIIWGEK